MAQNIYGTNSVKNAVSLNFVAAYITVAEKHYYNPFFDNQRGVVSHENDFVGFIHTVSGEGIVTLRGKTVTVKSNELIFIRYRDLLTMSTDNSEWHFYCLWFFLDNLRLDFHRTYKLEATDSELNQIREIIVQLNNNDYYSLCRANGLGLKLLSDLLDGINAENSSNRYPEALRDALFFINQNITSELPSVKELAERCNFCEKHFRVLFKNMTGLSPKQYIVKAKLEKAAFLLSYTALSVEEIANELYFPSSAYFIEQFRKHYKTTPASYRRNN